MQAKSINQDAETSAANVVDTLTGVGPTLHDPFSRKPLAEEIDWLLKLPRTPENAESRPMIDALYAKAYALYQNNRLDHAEQIFRFLCIYDFHNADYAFGLGAVYQLKQEYEKAIEMYSTAYIVDATALRAILYAGQCSLLSKRPDSAEQCFNLVIKESTDPDLVATAIRYRDALAIPASDAGEFPRK